MPGFLVVSADASQIEARVVAWLAKCWKLVQAFANKEDVYSTFASIVYDTIINKRDHPGQRFVGKTAVLGLGFGMGPPKFSVTCRNQGRAQGLSLADCTVELPLAQRVVGIYRTEYREVPELWKLMEDEVLPALANRLRKDFGVFYTDVDQSIVLPNGMRLFYRNMRREMVPDMFNSGKSRIQWVYEYGRETKYTFGGKMTENVVQALAKIITMNAAVRIKRATQGTNTYHVLAGQIHDQLIYVTPKELASDFRDYVVEEMSRPLDWFATMPLAAEGEVGPNLLEAK